MSIKISSARHIQRSRGEYTGSIIPFGYRKDKEKKGRFVIKEDEAEVVEKIFFLFGEGKSYSEIARELNRLQILSPKGKLWGYQTVRGIIANEVYLGRMVQGARCSKEEDITIVEHTHEAIITPEMFEKARCQKEKISFHQEKREDTEEYLFKGLLKAANSGLTLCKTCYRKQRGQVLVKAYRSPKAFDSNGTPYKLIMIREEVLLSVVKKILLQYISVLEDTESRLCQDTMQKKQQQNIRCMEGEVQALKKKIARKKELLSDSYQDLADGILEPTDYKRLQKEYKEDIIRLEKESGECEKKLTEFMRLVNMENPYISVLKEFGMSQKITKDLLRMLITEIIVINSREIRIIFSFEDEFQNLCALAGEVTQK